MIYPITAIIWSFDEPISMMDDLSVFVAMNYSLDQ